MLNLKGKNVWQHVERHYEEYLDALICVLFSVVYKSCNDAASSLWNTSARRNIFQAVSLQTFK